MKTLFILSLISLGISVGSVSHACDGKTTTQTTAPQDEVKGRDLSSEKIQQPENRVSNDDDSNSNRRPPHHEGLLENRH